MRRRRVLLVLLWVLGTAAASLVALQGISSVGSRLVGRGPQSMTAAQIDAALSGLPKPVPKTTIGTTAVARPSSSAASTIGSPDTTTTVAADATTTVDPAVPVTDVTGSVLATTAPVGGKPGSTSGTPLTTRPGTGSTIGSVPSGGPVTTAPKPGSTTATTKAPPVTTAAPPTTQPPPPTTQPTTPTTAAPAVVCSSPPKVKTPPFGRFSAAYCSDGTFRIGYALNPGYTITSNGQSVDSAGYDVWIMRVNGPNNYTCTAQGTEGPAVSLSCPMT